MPAAPAQLDGAPGPIIAINEIDEDEPMTGMQWTWPASEGRGRGPAFVRARKGLLVVVAGVSLLLATPFHARAGSGARREPERREPERRERERWIRDVERDPREWFRGEREQSREERDRAWERLDTRSRRQVSEAVGEREMEREIDRRAFERLCSSRAASERPQGFDAVVRSGNLIVVCEAKSTERNRRVESLLGEAYGGARQGSLEWARAAAERVVESRTANWRERRAAEDVLRAEREGRLAVLVFVTQHERGRVRERSVYQTAGPPISGR